MNPSPFSLVLLLPLGRILLLGTIGYALFRVIDGEYDFEEAILGSIVGFLGLWFYADAFGLLDNISQQLSQYLGDHMDHRTLQEQLIAAIQKSPDAQTGTVPSIGTMFGQLWRAGVWGVVSSFVQLIFLISDYAVVVTQKVFSRQIFFFFPLACGLYPMFPKVFANMALYAVELSLWRPMLVIVHEITSIVAQDYLADDSTHGFQIIAVELVAIYLILSIPKTTHGVMQGVLAGDLGASGGFIHASKKAFAGAMTLVRGG